MTDNFFINCPAKGFNRDLTDFRPSSEMNEQIMKDNGLKNYDDYREYIIKNGTSALPVYGKRCWNNENIHNQKTARQNPSTFYNDIVKSNTNLKKIYAEYKK